MNSGAIIPEDKTPSLMLIALQLVSVLGAGVFLYTSRFYSIALVPAILLLGMAVFLAGYSRHRIFSILLIGVFTSLILSLRFDYLMWGDPWFELGMIQRILAYQSIDPSIYPSQLPVMHLIIASLSLFSGINPLYLLKFITPLLSVIGLYAVYRLTEDISSSTKTAFFAGFLLLCGTPYLHWTTQGVRETLGIALFILALYVSFTAIKSHKKGYLLLSILLIGGLVLTHELSSVLFLLVWIAVSLTFLYLMCDMNRVPTTGLFSLLIASTTIIFIIAWGWGRSLYGYSQFSSLANTVFHSEYGILLFVLSLICLYLLIPLKIPDKILLLRSLVTKILIRKNCIYIIFIAGTVVSSGVVLSFILGKSSFVLSYPPSMFFNGICMILLSLIGLYLHLLSLLLKLQPPFQQFHD